MKQKEQLQEILCTVESVEKDVKELRFWTILKHNRTGDELKYIWDLQVKWKRLDEYDSEDELYFFNTIIWNPLSLKHLMMYCAEKRIILSFCWESVQQNIDEDHWTEFRYITDEYNPEKELYEQEYKVLLDIINFLKGV